MKIKGLDDLKREKIEGTSPKMSLPVSRDYTQSWIPSPNSLKSPESPVLVMPKGVLYPKVTGVSKGNPRNLYKYVAPLETATALPLPQGPAGQISLQDVGRAPPSGNESSEKKVCVEETKDPLQSVVGEVKKEEKGEKGKKVSVYIEFNTSTFVCCIPVCVCIGVLCMGL